MEQHTDEIWKDIDGFPMYQVSNYGKVLSKFTNKCLTPARDKDGYARVGLRRDKKTFNKRVARLVAIAFIPNPEGLPIVNHKDEDKSNDYVGNLEWCTVQYNNTYGSRLEKVSKKLLGHELFGKGRIITLEERKMRSKTSGVKRKVNQIDPSTHEIIKTWDSMADYGRAIGINPQRTAVGIWNVCTKRGHTYHGYIWEYADEGRKNKKEN